MTLYQITYDRDQFEWGSRTRYDDGTLRPFVLDKIVIHWGGHADPDGPDNQPSESIETAILRRWQRDHIDVRGWKDIAYGYGVGNTSLIYRLRGMNRQGATSGDLDNDGILENYEALAIVWIGGKGSVPSLGAYASMGRIIRQLLSQHPNAVVEVAKFVTVHSDHRPTQCPGDAWRLWVKRQGWKDDMADPVPSSNQGDHQMETLRLYDGYDTKNTPEKRFAVMALQAMLRGRGHKDPNTEDKVCGIDGKFGFGTQGALKDFQQKSGFVIDGICGPITWAALEG